LLKECVEVVGTFSVGANPLGVIFDRADIWVANAGGNTVTKLRARDGAPDLTASGSRVRMASKFGPRTDFVLRTASPFSPLPT
jgi:DNA-binding beta-propeller fold protein YncE